MSFEEKSKKWVKDNKYLFGILVLAFLIRLFYFFQTGSQPLWWDEAEYMSMAKHIFFDVPFTLNPQRPILFPLLEGIVMAIFNRSEIMVRFILVFLPSMVLVYVSYLLGKEMFNEKIGLMVAFLHSISWIIIFNTTRVHTDLLAMLMLYFAMLLLWRFVQGNKKYVWLIGPLIILAFMTRLSSALFGFIILAFLILVYKLDFLKEKKLWIAAVLGLIILTPFLVWGNSEFGSTTAFLSGSHVTNPGSDYDRAPGWHIATQVLPWLFAKPYGQWSILSLNGFIAVTSFLLFVIYFLVIVGILALSFDYLIKKGKEYKNKADLLIILWILVYLIYFIFLERDAEDRWLMPMAFALFVILSKAIFFIKKQIKNSSAAKAFIIVVILGLFFLQLSTADDLIVSRISSYGPVKDSALWVKERTGNNDTIMSQSFTQFAYYSERRTLGYGGDDVSYFENVLLTYKPKYAVASIFEAHPEWTFPYLQGDPERFVPVQAYNINEQPALVIFEIKCD